MKKPHCNNGLIQKSDFDYYCVYVLGFSSAVIRWAFDNNCEHVFLNIVFRSLLYAPANKQTNRSCHKTWTLFYILSDCMDAHCTHRSKKTSKLK